MSSHFRISEKLTLPADAVTWVLAFLAKRNAGKTYCASVLAEEMLKQQIPVVVIDGMGIWWGLRVGKGGEGNGLPIVVFGGDHGDLPLVPEKAKQIAKAVVEANISAVLDLSTLSKRASRLVVTDFLDELYKLNRIERHVFIEETDMFAPQRTIGPEMATCLGAVDNFVRRGGNHNLGCSLITQRSAVLNKDILTQADCLVILRTLAPQDKKAIQAWVEEQTDEDRRKLNQWYDSLKQLPNGVAWIWHPEKPTIYQKIQFRQRETFHATRQFLLTSKAATIKLMDVGEFVEKFRNVFEPKPKPATSQLQSVRKITQTPSEVHLEHVPIPVISGLQRIVEQPHQGQLATVPHQLPYVVLVKDKPTVQVLNEPQTPLGRVIVILDVNKLNDWRWTAKKIKALMRDHSWTDEGADEAIQQLIQWEILRKQSNNYLHFDRKRVRVIEDESVCTIQ